MRFRVERNTALNTFEVWAAFGVCVGKDFLTRADAEQYIDSGAAQLYIDRQRKDTLLLGYVATPEHLRELMNASQ